MRSHYLTSVFSESASCLLVLCVPRLCPRRRLLHSGVLLSLKSLLVCRLARTLLEVLNARMAVRCGLLFVPQAAVERLKAEGTRKSLCASSVVSQSVLKRWLRKDRGPYRISVVISLLQVWKEQRALRGSHWQPQRRLQWHVHSSRRRMACWPSNS